MFWNLSISADVLMNTEYNFAKQNIGELLHYLQEVKDSIELALCSIEYNGLSQLVNLNSSSLRIGPLDIVRNVRNSTRQMQVVLMTYQLTSVIENVCSTSGIPRVLNQLLLEMAQ